MPVSIFVAGIACIAMAVATGEAEVNRLRVASRRYQEQLDRELATAAQEMRRLTLAQNNNDLVWSYVPMVAIGLSFVGGILLAALGF